MSDNIANGTPNPVRSAFSIDYLDMRIPTVVSNIFDSIYRMWNKTQDSDVESDRERDIEYSDAHLELALNDFKSQKASGSMIGKNNDQDSTEASIGSTEELHTVQYESIATTQATIIYLEHEMSTDITYPAIIQNNDFATQNNCEVSNQQTEISPDEKWQSIDNQHEKIVFSRNQSLVNQIESLTDLEQNTRRSSRCSKQNPQISPSEVVYGLSHQRKIAKVNKKNVLTRIPQRSSKQNSMINEKQPSPRLSENIVTNNGNNNEDSSIDKKANESKISLCQPEGLIGTDSDTPKPVDPSSVHGTGERIMDDEFKSSDSLSSVELKLSTESSPSNLSKKFSCHNNDVLMKVTHSENTTTTTTTASAGKLVTEKELNQEKECCNHQQPQPSQIITCEDNKSEQELQHKDKQSIKIDKKVEQQIGQSAKTTEDASTMSTDLQQNVEIQADDCDDKESEELYEEQVYKYSERKIDSCLQTSQSPESTQEQTSKPSKLNELAAKTRQLDNQEKRRQETRRMSMQDKPCNSKIEQPANKVKDVDFEKLNIRTPKSTLNMSYARKISDEPTPTAKAHNKTQRRNIVDAKGRRNSAKVSSITITPQKLDKSTNKENVKTIPMKEPTNSAQNTTQTSPKMSTITLSKNDSNHIGNSNSIYNFYNQPYKMNNVILMSMPYGNICLKEKTTNLSPKISTGNRKSDLKLQSKPQPSKMKLDEVMHRFNTRGSFSMSTEQLFVHGQPARPTLPFPGYCYGSIRYAPFITSTSS